jgi:hypothetical protein
MLTCSLILIEIITGMIYKFFQTHQDYSQYEMIARDLIQKLKYAQVRNNDMGTKCALGELH